MQSTYREWCIRDLERLEATEPDEACREAAARGLGAVALIGTEFYGIAGRGGQHGHQDSEDAEFVA